MKILHTADWHLGELPGPTLHGENARLLDTLRCIDFLCETAEKEQPDAILIAGDLFHRSQMWASPMLRLIELAVERLRQLASVAPTVLLFGTANHDNPAAFDNIRALDISKCGLRVITRPCVFVLSTKSGHLQVAAVPGLDKGHFRAMHPGMDPEQENVICSKLLGDIILGLGAQMDPSIPSVLTAHYAVTGCEYDNGQTHIFHQSEVTLPIEALAAAPFDLVCLGHIHRWQSVPHCGRPVYYSGSINRLAFNEEGSSKGFWIHDLNSPNESAWFETPARWFTTVHVFPDADKQFNFPEMFADDPVAALRKYGEEIDPVKDAIVRVHYSCDEETRKRMNHKAIEKALYDAGAFYVQEIKPVQIITALTKQEMTENAGPLENLGAWLEKEGFGESEVTALVELARPLIEQVSAQQPTGKLSGVFEPRLIEVRNYRSFRDAAFDFTSISYATVNGPNGVGKSALFMDAISDCLFEETREGELTGWITNGEKSGSITFEFSMGELVWRVVRTRARSGKTTLALQEKVRGQWVDRSAEKVRDTQDRIVALLGMDALTFGCCGLIKQDAYGIFLEADREDRMQVLGNILGLGVYEHLEKLAKEKVTETNRELEVLKRKLAELDAGLVAKPGIEQGLAAALEEIEQVAAQIREQEADLRNAEQKLAEVRVKGEKAEELRRQLEHVANELHRKKQEFSHEAGRLEKADKMLAAEAQILEKAAEHDRVKEQVTVLRTKRPRLKDLESALDRLSNDSTQVNSILYKLGTQITEVEKALANKAELEKSYDELQAVYAEIEQLDRLAEHHAELREQIADIEKELDHELTQKTFLERQLQNLESKASMLADSGCVDPERAACRFLADAQEAKSEIPKVEKQVSALDESAEPKRRAVTVIDKQVQGLGYDPRRHAELKERAKELAVRAEEFTRLSAKAELLNALRQQQAQREEESINIQKHMQAKQTEARALAEELRELPSLEERLPKLDAWVKAKEELPAARQIQAAASERMRSLDQEIAAKRKQVNKLEEDRALLVAETAAADQYESTAAQLRSSLEGLRGTQNILHAKAGGLSAQLESLVKDEEARQKTSEQLAPAAAAVTRYQTLAKAFGQDGIPFSIVRSVVPELSAMANDILGQMTGGKMSLEMRTERVLKSNKKEVNALEIWINDYQRGSMPYKSRSGGQKVKAALSVAFALADLKARRAGIQLGMMFVDEPPFLDSEGTDAYCDALELMSGRYPNMRVIAISHDPRMKARFPQQVEVEDAGEAGSQVRIAS